MSEILRGPNGENLGIMGSTRGVSREEYQRIKQAEIDKRMAQKEAGKNNFMSFGGGGEMGIMNAQKVTKERPKNNFMSFGGGGEMGIMNASAEKGKPKNNFMSFGGGGEMGIMNAPAPLTGTTSEGVMNNFQPDPQRDQPRTGLDVIAATTNADSGSTGTPSRAQQISSAIQGLGTIASAPNSGEMGLISTRPTGPKPESGIVTKGKPKNNFMSFGGGGEMGIMSMGATNQNIDLNQDLNQPETDRPAPMRFAGEAAEDPAVASAVARQLEATSAATTDEAQGNQQDNSEAIARQLAATSAPTTDETQGNQQDNSEAINRQLQASLASTTGGTQEMDTSAQEQASLSPARQRFPQEYADLGNQQENQGVYATFPEYMNEYSPRQSEYFQGGNRGNSFGPTFSQDNQYEYYQDYNSPQQYQFDQQQDYGGYGQYDMGNYMDFNQVPQGQNNFGRAADFFADAFQQMMSGANTETAADQYQSAAQKQQRKKTTAGSAQFR